MNVNSVFDIAKFLLFLKENDQRGLEISNSKLQILLYYCEGFSLAMYDSSIFINEVEAWKQGPVVPEVHTEYKTFGDLDIRSDNNNNNYNLLLNKKSQSIVAYVWKTLGEYTSCHLIRKSQCEAPWLNAWFCENKNKIISKADIKYHCKKNIPNTLLNQASNEEQQRNGVAYDK